MSERSLNTLNLVDTLRRGAVDHEVENVVAAGFRFQVAPNDSLSTRLSFT